MGYLQSKLVDNEQRNNCDKGRIPPPQSSEFILAKKNRQTGWDSPISHSQRASSKYTATSAPASRRDVPGVDASR